MPAANAITLTVDSEEQQQMKWGLDYERLWFWYGSTENKELIAQWSVADCDVDYIRVAINSAYELTKGEYDLSAYTQKIIPMMTSMQEANPDIKFFASPRPLDEAINDAAWQPYPYWITGDPGDGSSFDFEWENAAEYLVRYVKLMNSYGFSISYLDISNEWNYVTPKHFKYIRNHMIDELGDEMPLIVGNSAWSFSQGVSWLKTMENQNVMSGIDIAASHNTGYSGTAEEFYEQASSMGKEVWDSEVHGWKGSTTVDEISSVHYMLDRIRAGFSGLDAWLTIGTTSQQHSYILNTGSVSRNVKYYIFQKLANNSNYGYALDVNLPDELTSTVALIDGSLMTVWVLNNDSAQSDVTIELGGHLIKDGTSIVRTRWHEDIAIEGVAESVQAATINSFSTDIAANSLYSFEIELDLDADTTPETEANPIVTMQKRNALGFGVDGNNGAANEQDVYLWSYNADNINQQWEEIDRGNGYYSYKKYETEYCLDGDNGGDNRQNVYLWSCADNNYNQHWQKLWVEDDYYRLIKRNASGYALDGNNGAENAQSIYLWSNSETNYNQHWKFTKVGTAD